MARYYVVEMWENLDFPVFDYNPVTEDTSEVFTTNDRDLAIEQAEGLHDGYVLDFEELKIIKVNQDA